MSPCARAGQLLGIPMLSISMSISIRRNDGADLALERRESQFGFFNARACGPARVKAHLAGIDARERNLLRSASPIPATRRETPMNAARTRPRCRERPIQQPDIAVAQPLKKRVEQMVRAPDEPLPAAGAPSAPCRYKSNLGIQQIGHHGRHQRAGQADRTRASRKPPPWRAA